MLKKKCNEKFNKLIEKIANSSVDNNTSDFLVYSTTPLGDIARIFVSLVIIICLLNVAFVFFADY